MRRREFIAALGAAAAWPSGGHAQQKAIPVIGVLGAITNDLTAFYRGLEGAGYVQGRNVAIEYHWGAANRARAREVATDLVRQQVAVILAFNDGPALAAKRATSTIPIVFTSTATDPVRLGLVASLNQPGGNVTGVAFLQAQLANKRIDLLYQVVPAAATIAYLANPDMLSFEEEKDALMAAAGALGRQLIVVECRSDDQLQMSFHAIVERAFGGLIVAAVPLFSARNIDKIVAFAAQHKIPAIYPFPSYAFRGGLMSYSANYADNLRTAGGLVGQILNGAKPADLPVRMAAEFDFVVNLKTSKQLGLEIPEHLLAFASNLIE
jgi:putative ABC transport system substrate-binding protein